MAHRIAAVVNVTMEPSEVAEILGVPEESLIDYGNGTALINIVEDILDYEDALEDLELDDEEE